MQEFRPEEAKQMINRILNVREERRTLIIPLNEDEKELYEEAKAMGLNVKAIKAVIKHIEEKNKVGEDEVFALESDIEIYKEALEG